MTERGRKPRTWPGGLPRRIGEHDFERPLRARHAELSGHEALPIAHVASVHGSRTIIESSRLIPRRCEVFGIDLAYFFVLKPAYLGKSDTQKSEFLDYFPLALILRPEAVPIPHHVYPFDTGGAASGAFKKRANKFVPLEDYELEASHAAAAGFIGWAFGDVASYLDGSLRRNLQSEVKPAESVPSAYLAIARLGVSGDPEHDTRASTLEVASAENVDLKGNVLLVVMPKQLLEVPGPFLDALSRLTASGTEVDTYDWRPNRAPAEFQRDILRVTRAWHATNGYVG